MHDITQKILAEEQGWAERAASNVAIITAVLARYPDAVVERVSGAIVADVRLVFRSASAHQDAAAYNPLCVRFADNPRDVRDALYIVVETPVGPVRVYSAFKYDVLQGFEDHHESDVPLVEAIKAARVVQVSKVTAALPAEDAAPPN